MAQDAEPDKVKFTDRFKQIGTAAGFVAKADKRFVTYAIAIVVAALAVGALVILFVAGGLISTVIWVVLIVLATITGLLSLLNVRSQRLFMKQAEETPGAVTQVIEGLRWGKFRVTPALASTTQFDMVHLVLSRRGVILVGEGPNPARIRQMLGQEKRRLAKVIGGAQMSDIIVGDGAGEVPIRKIGSVLRKMPQVISPADVNALDIRLKALTARPAMPKGAIPKNMRPASGGIRAPRGR
jgi:hypothetical protein